MKRRTLLKGLAGFAGAGIVAPFVSRAHAEASMELVVSHCWPAHDVFHKEITEDFNAVNPNIKITYTNSPANYEEGHQLILRQALTNQLPDIFYSGFHLLPPLGRQLRQRGQITLMDDFIKAEGAEWVKANYSDRILGLANFDGVQMAMPFNTSTPIVYFNEELVKQAGGDPNNFPTTWDGIFELAAKIDALGDDIDGMFYGVHTQTDDWLWQALVFSHGGDLMDAADQKVAFGSEAGKGALTIARRMVTEGKMQLREDQQAVQQFFAGKTGIIVRSTASLRGTTDSVGKNFTLRTTTYPLAVPNGGLPTGGNALVITTTDAAKAAAAWTFAKWVSGPEGQTVAVKFSGYMPTSLRSEEEKYLGAFYKENPNYTTTLKQIPVARKWYGYPGTNSNRIIKAQKEIINTVMRGDVSVDDGLKQMVDATQALLPSLP